MNGGDATMNLWNWEFCVHFLLSVLTVRTNWFFFSTTSEGTCLWQFFFLPLSSISQTFGLIAPIFVRYPLNDVNVWVGLGLTNLNCWEKILQKKTFKKLNFEIITKNIWITNSKTIVSISVKWKKKKTTPYNVNFKINEMLILIFITVFI